MSEQTDRFIRIRRGHPFKGDSQYGYHARVDPNGVVSVYSHLAGHYLTSHSLSIEQQRYIRARARVDGPAVRCEGE